MGGGRGGDASERSGRAGGRDEPTSERSGKGGSGRVAVGRSGMGGGIGGEIGDCPCLDEERLGLSVIGGGRSAIGGGRSAIVGGWTMVGDLGGMCWFFSHSSLQLT